MGIWELPCGDLPIYSIHITLPTRSNILHALILTSSSPSSDPSISVTQHPAPSFPPQSYTATVSTSNKPTNQPPHTSHHRLPISPEPKLPAISAHPMSIHTAHTTGPPNSNYCIEKALSVTKPFSVLQSEQSGQLNKLLPPDRQLLVRCDR